MAANPQKAFDWAAFDKLLVPEKPGPEWVSTPDLVSHCGYKIGPSGVGGRAFVVIKSLISSNKLEKKKFKGPDGKWRNYYRIKQTK